FRERLEDGVAVGFDAAEVVARDAEEIASLFLRQLVGREVPGGRGEEEAGGLFLDDDRGGGRGIDLVSGHDELGFPGGEAVRLEGVGLRALPEMDTEMDGRGLAPAELVFFFQMVDEGVDDLGGG